MLSVLILSISITPKEKPLSPSAISSSVSCLFLGAPVSKPHWFAVLCFVVFSIISWTQHFPPPIPTCPDRFASSCLSTLYHRCSGLLTENPPFSFFRICVTSCLHLDHPCSQTCILVLLRPTFSPNFQSPSFQGTLATLSNFLWFHAHGHNTQNRVFCYCR